MAPLEPSPKPSFAPVHPLGYSPPLHRGIRSEGFTKEIGANRYQGQGFDGNY